MTPMSHSRREILVASLAGAARAAAGAAPSKPPIQTRIFWTWDHSTEWALHMPGAQNFGASSGYMRYMGFPKVRFAGNQRAEMFLRDYGHLLEWCSRHGVDAVVIWGLLRDAHGGVETAKRLCDLAAKR